MPPSRGHDLKPTRYERCRPRLWMPPSRGHDLKHDLGQEFSKGMASGISFSGTGGAATGYQPATEGVGAWGDIDGSHASGLQGGRGTVKRDNIRSAGVPYAAYQFIKLLVCSHKVKIINRLIARNQNSRIRSCLYLPENR